MLTDLARRFDDLPALARALEGWSAAYPYEVRGRGRAGEILLPHRPALPWPLPKRRLTLKTRRTVAGYEQSATAAFDFVAEHAPFETFYDLGAAGGYFGFLAAARQDMAIEAHCFEMLPHAVEALRAMAARHGLSRMHVHASGMSDAFEGEKTIWHSVTKMFEEEPDPSAWRDPWHWRVKFWLQGRAGRDRLQQATVTVDSVDAFTARNGLAPGLIKIDVDGYEAKVIPGGLETVARHRPVIFLELHKTRFFAHHGVTRPQIPRPLFDLGYSALMFTNHHDLTRNTLVPVGPDSPELAREETDFFMFV